MSTPPVLPLMADGTLPPVPFLLRWLAHVAEQGLLHVSLDRLPPGNGSLPDLLAGVGIRMLTLTHPPIAHPFQWEGWAGGRVLVGDGDPGPALHHGELPSSACTGVVAHALDDALTRARAQDAATVRDDSGAHGDSGAAEAGAPWSHLLRTFGPGLQGGPAPSSVATDDRLPTAAVLGAWNPLALERRVVVRLPAPPGAPPIGLRDQRGVRHPVQVIDEAGGRLLLVSVQLGALEAVTFEPLPDKVPGCHWEVTRSVIDNGRVRAELDDLGQVVRLCCDGRFVDWSGPALQPMISNLPLSGTCAVDVLESGPVRGRIVLTRVTPHGTLCLDYRVHAHEPVLRVAATWDGSHEVRLACPTLVHAAPLEVGGDLAAWTVPQGAEADSAATPPIAGLRWARLGEEDRRGLAVFALQPMRMSAIAGTLSLHLAHSADIALCESAWPEHAPGIAATALALGTPAHPATASAPPLLRVVGVGVVPWWIGRPAGWKGELLLGQPHARRGRCTVYVAAAEAVRQDLRGDPVPLRRTADGDGFEIDLTAGDLAAIRWR